MEPRPSTSSAPLQCDNCKAPWPDGRGASPQCSTTSNRCTKPETEQREEALGPVPYGNLMPQTPVVNAWVRGAVRYSILDRPPWAECVLLGFQVGLDKLGLVALHLVVALYVDNS